MQFVFRQIELLDESFLWEMLYHALYLPEGAASFPRDIVREPVIAQYVSGWGRAGDFGFIAQDQTTGKLAGAVWLRQFSSGAPAYGFIDEDTPELSIALLPEYRKQGLGTQLLERLIAAVKDTYGAISLSVSRENPAVRLYKRFGFVIVNDTSGSLKMSKSLK